MSRKPLYELREVHLWQDGDRYIVTVDGNDAAEAEFDNPLEAWSRFADILDARVRRRIGDMLDRHGRNRYTGKEKG